MASFPFSVCIICATKAPAAVRDFLMPPSSQMGIQLTLLILSSCSLYSMYPSSSSSSFSESSSLALLVLVISTCLSLLFTNLRKLLRDNTHKAKAPASMEEAVTVYQEKSIVPQDEVPEDAPEGLMGNLSDSSECTTNDEEEGTEEGSMSDEADDDDDESLIEISLVDGHYVGGAEQAEQRCAYNYKKDLLAEFLPDLLLDRRDFFDILSEISEEDSLIEIDIARGSIKCSNLDIKA
ncbi:unnamed protein product [Miscanthus lutarioriparius]|uniref:Uncharacterized protein n=1 Tax=Miscanthus lutarioriparius TaxID=422564 RepID=A0A811RJ50_9POAL|nr:unnamed protein product [Miscanthus lutarioriparius]